MKTLLRIGDKQIAIEHPEGTELQMEGNRLYAEAAPRSLEHQLTEEMGKQGIQWGDAIAWATHKMGIQQCAACAKRQFILNRVKQAGLVETVKQIAETLRGGK